MLRFRLCILLIAVLWASIPALGGNLDEGRISSHASQMTGGLRNDQLPPGTAGGQQPYSARPQLAGTWNWMDGQTLVVHRGGTFDVYLKGQKINDGSWMRVGGNRFRLLYRTGGGMDTLELSRDGNTLVGADKQHQPLHGTRSGPPISPSPRSSPDIRLAGIWNWVSGQSLVIHPDGTSEVNQKGQKVNDGQWTSLGGDKYRLVHRVGGEVDTVTLTPDGNTLDGTDNQNWTLHGSRH